MWLQQLLGHDPGDIEVHPHSAEAPAIEAKRLADVVDAIDRSLCKSEHGITVWNQGRDVSGFGWKVDPVPFREAADGRIGCDVCHERQHGRGHKQALEELAAVHGKDFSMTEDLDVESRGETLDGAEPRDPDDPAEGAGEAVKAKRPKTPKHQGRRGRRDREDASGTR